MLILAVKILLLWYAGSRQKALNDEHFDQAVDLLSY